jgi:hypothetical protein
MMMQGGCQWLVMLKATIKGLGRKISSCLKISEEKQGRRLCGSRGGLCRTARFHPKA